MKALHLKIPLVVFKLLIAACMWIITRLTPSFSFTLLYHKTLASIISIVGGVISGLGILSFRLAKTTFNSVQLDSVSSFVVSGVYSFTRNPMYLGLLFVLLGWFCYLSNVLALLFFHCIFFT